MNVAELTVVEQVQARIWEALRHVADPEIPVSVLGLGLIVSVGYSPEERAAELEITFTAMGCPATDFIEDDIREALLADPEIEQVRIEVVWDPIWTKARIRADARQTMRRLGILV
jgi:metal-sulfur cluster biosynthetic enzyme